MNPGIMLKALASFLNITPEEIAGNFEQIRGVAVNGVRMLEQIDTRLKRIEEKLGITEIGADTGDETRKAINDG